MTGERDSDGVEGPWSSHMPSESKAHKAAALKLLFFDLETDQSPKATITWIPITIDFSFWIMTDTRSECVKV